jgi:coniferyl-aldehyde dehydrogenase
MLLPVPATPEAELQRILRVQHEAFAADRYPDLATRRDRLTRLINLVDRHEAALVAAVSRDFGHRAT